MHDFLSLAHERYSCRMLSDEPVSREDIDKIIEAAIAAPTAKNSQPYRIYSFESPEALAKVRELTPYHFGAPVILLVAGKTDEAYVRHFDEASFCETDTAIVATHLMLEVADLGLGTTWVGHFDAPAMRKAFPELANDSLLALFPIGHPADDAHPSPRHTERRDAAEAVVRL